MSTSNQTRTVVNPQHLDQYETVAAKKHVSAEVAGFQNRLRQAVDQRRREAELGQNEFARSAGIDPGGLSKMLTGSQLPSLSSAGQLALALRVSLDWLVNGIEPSGLGPVRDVRDLKGALGAEGNEFHEKVEGSRRVERPKQQQLSRQAGKRA